MGYSPFKMAPKSPLMKKLVGNQDKLPQQLQDAIKAAPESPAKQTTKGLNTAGRKVEYMKSLAADQDKEQIEGRAADHVKVMSARGNWGTPIVERSKQASDYANYNEKKREKNIYKPARDKAAKKFDKATRYDDMLGRASSPTKQTTAGEFAYEKSLKDKKMGKSTKVVDKFTSALEAPFSDKTYSELKKEKRAKQKAKYNAKK